MPKVSVIMSVYNNAPYLQEAVSSILCQSFRDFELLIFDDCSTDGSSEILDSIKDPRVRVIHNSYNRGLVANLNAGLDMAQSKYIARMDGDDISYPDRFLLQIQFMDANPDIGLCSTAMQVSTAGKPKINPLRHEDIQAWLLFHCCISHPVVMMRNSIIQQHHIRYDANYPHAEDYELWNRVAPYVKMANLPEVLFYYRRHTGQVSSQHVKVQNDSAKRVRMREFNNLGLYPTEEEYKIHMRCVDFAINPHDPVHYYPALAWAEKLLAQNRVAKRFNQEALNIALSRCISRLPY
ncbi:glycosyltransferase family 2 protein [Paenibacillus tarimensis]|uniref:glycosyltransferase family 2 protein n=1 Tax=Paenibacillus tarimensis TaxID=416012 RepID=UPI001F43684F|nr:glycosyltransferase [Paenibacillus tarimensis]MCF2945397.1 glycosyltransferase [Paenibacillus tarimensis]